MTEPLPLSRLVGALRDLVGWFNATGGRAAVIGGVAVALQSRPRTTRDIDALVLRDPSEWDKFLQSGVSFGFEPRIADPLAFAAKARVLLMEHTASGIPVDVTLGTLPFEEELVARVDRVSVAETEIPVASAADLIIMKAVAHRVQDLADIESLVQTAATLDLDRIRRWVREFSSVLETPEILEDLEKILRMR